MDKECSIADKYGAFVDLQLVFIYMLRSTFIEQKRPTKDQNVQVWIVVDNDFHKSLSKMVYLYGSWSLICHEMCNTKTIYICVENCFNIMLFVVANTFLKNAIYSCKSCKRGSN